MLIKKHNLLKKYNPFKKTTKKESNGILKVPVNNRNLKKLLKSH